MIDRGKQNLLGVAIDAVDYDAAVAQIIAAAQAPRGMAVSALAVHGVMTGVQDGAQRHRLNHFDLLVPDGQPVRWALNWLHHTHLPDRVYGPTLTLKLCERAAQEELPVYFYGSRPEVLTALRQNLQRKFPALQIAGMSPSLFRRTTQAEKTAIAQQIRESGARLVFVGLGCPRQEVWAYEYREILDLPIIAVGAAFDFHAGTVAQAPPRLQQLGLEWLYRLLQEPRRLWRRYIVLNPWYVALVLAQASGLRHVDPRATLPPADELLYG